MKDWVVSLDQVGMRDVDRVGGKNASLGEMITNLHSLGVSVPTGFATTASAYRDFLAQNQLTERIQARLAELDVSDVNTLMEAGREIRDWIVDAPLQPELEQQIVSFLAQLQEGDVERAVAVRSSATAEDLPDASFAGQQETFLNVRGEAQVLTAIKAVFASLFNDRAIAYRVHQGFAHADVALSASVQLMVASESAASGVMFTLDTESGFDDVIFITSAYGLGETVVQGAVNPDEFYLYKPSLKQNRPSILRRTLGAKAIKMVYDHSDERQSMVKTVEVPDNERRRFSLTDEEAHELARQALVIEQHYQCPMDIEWAKDGVSGHLFIVQARPETVQSRSSKVELKNYELKEQGRILAQGRAIGKRIGSGAVKVVQNIADMDEVSAGDVLVTDMTDPDWEPVMKRASAIVTNRGGRTCHAAIIARELGVPAVVGCGNATQVLADVPAVTVCCAEGDTGLIYEGLLDFEVHSTNLDSMPELPFKIMMNVATPDRAFDFHFIPNAGVGLARLEFVINSTIGIHPKALLNYDRLSAELQAQIDMAISGYASPVDFYRQKLIEGISTLTAAFAPQPVIVRFSDFKSNEYANLMGGELYEPEEENPMLGFRGASRYISEEFADCFQLECEAVQFVRDEMGLTNLEVMVPFTRTLGEAEAVTAQLAANGLQRGVNGLRVIMMCEIPSNALLAEQFLEFFDGFSIGSNDMTQLTLGLDRDSNIIAHLFDERNEAVKALLSMAIQACRKQGKYIGICGQGPSDHPDLAKWLMEEGIESVSLNPDSVVKTWLYLAKERELL